MSANGTSVVVTALDPGSAGKARENARRKHAQRERDPDGPVSLLPGAGQVAPPGGMERTEFFGRLKIPMTNGMPKGSK